MKFYIETFGCQMNEHDTEKMEHLLLKDGFERTQDVSVADVVIVNTCCVREKAEQKFYSFMGRLRSMKNRRGTILGVTGCIAQMEKEHIKERLPFIDFSIGPSSIHRIKEAIEEGAKSKPFLDFSDNGCNPYLFIKPGIMNKKAKTYVTIMKGCNNFCSYCIVPYVRGREVSRESEDIIKEIEDLTMQGVKEVTLLGQNVNSFNKGRDDIAFPELLKRINGIHGIERIRFVTSHPRDLSFELIDCFGTLEKLCEHIHLPFQSGSDKVLKLMNRGYGIKEYVEKIMMLRNRCEDISITADCIVGFPGEEEEDFNQTVELIRHVRFDGIFSFVYSPRKHTFASTLSDEVPRALALERLVYLQGIQKSITLDKNRDMEGKEVDVLVEDVSKNSKEDLAGRTRTNKIVNFRGNQDMAGRFVRVGIIKGYANSLKGELISKEA
ncbi:MAG: tRNA (N6-isopentenyl adenosine(37)-C2)-methylthiotransferase MiaB [Proteobacteria bacterium]|nr:tRNA (N6-isopentenyl adenosine(37)-C2)-methylthiotransferase MiaB [Pseudomonadota bacterium]